MATAPRSTTQCEFDAAKMGRLAYAGKPHRRADVSPTVKAPYRSDDRGARHAHPPPGSAAAEPSRQFDKARGVAGFIFPKPESRATLTPCAPQPKRWRQSRYGEVQPEVSPLV